MKCQYVLKQAPRSLVSGALMYYYSCFRSGSHMCLNQLERDKLNVRVPEKLKDVVHQQWMSSEMKAK
ncbi:unnamed protein product [Larinioides sclopetarius]|uniref:Uncharacterized protein n=1 Tax=Larinioides sclopetarius TaxID=280406 RepID=A0AAV1ZKR2_9ARAC